MKPMKLMKPMKPMKPVKLPEREREVSSLSQGGMKPVKLKSLMGKGFPDKFHRFHHFHRFAQMEAFK